MKLAIIIANKDIASDVAKTLSESNFVFSSNQSYHSPLEKSSTTFMIPIKDNQVETIKKIVKQKASLHSETISAPVSMGSEMDSMITAQSTQEIKSGGATIMILPLDSVDIM